jgi:hypothetical protein
VDPVLLGSASQKDLKRVQNRIKERMHKVTVRKMSHHRALQKRSDAVHRVVVARVDLDPQRVEFK